MPIKLNSVGGGSVTLDVPSTGSTFTHTMPAETGTVITSSTGSGINASALSVGTLPKARLPSGSILQVSQTFTTTETVLSGTFDTTILSASITPLFSTSRVYIIIRAHAFNQSSGTDMSFGERLLRNSTQVFFNGESMYHNISLQKFEHIGFDYLDSPATTSSITYNYQIRGTNRGTMNFNRGSTTGSSMTLMEIAG
jgi:hypothetical protein